ncbi:MAG: hypothetical protein GVY19_07675 [Bacteroidetes bacterium]|jgi:hypothetical protein|nr:hypothetical protein [Bacteroidota bacterium]
MHLTSEQISHIEALIDKAGINYSHLKEDLVDHLCCDVEQQMTQGLSFQAALEQVLIQCSLEHLFDLQKQTLLLTNKLYAIMKSIVKSFGVIVPIMITAGALFKNFHLPGASVLLTLGFLLLCFLLIPAVAIISYKELNDKKNLVLHVWTAVAAIFLCTGLIFKIMHWPGANYIMFASIVFLLLLIPVLLIEFRKRLRSNASLILAFTGIILLLTSILFKMFHWPGATIILAFSFIIIGFLTIPIYLVQANGAPQKVLLAVILAIYIPVFGIVSVHKLNYTFEGDYKSMHERLDQIKIPHDFTNGTKSFPKMDFTNNYNQILAEFDAIETKLKSKLKQGDHYYIHSQKDSMLISEMDLLHEHIASFYGELVNHANEEQILIVNQIKEQLRIEKPSYKPLLYIHVLDRLHLKRQQFVHLNQLIMNPKYAQS